jgi:outer membrane protein TolC
MVAAEQMMTEIKRRFDVGVATNVALLQGQTELMQTRLRLEQLRDTLDLRRRALAGTVKQEEIRSALRRLELTLEVKRIELDLQLARARADELRKRVAVGTASEIEVKRAELELLERQIDLKRVRQEIEMLASGKRE